MVDDGKPGAAGAADPLETAQPTVQPTMQPTMQPTVQPTVQPTMQPTVQPSDGSEAELGVATADLRSGMIVDGKYRLDRLIGKGGMGHVWLCSHMHMLGDIAVKILIDRLRGRQQSIERFWQEARLMGALGHPNIVRIFDVSPSTADVPYLAMEYLPRESLRHHLKKEKTIEPEEAIRLLDGVLSALIAAHKRGIIHRDIKPENLMFADVRDINTDELRTELKVLDFGASILLDPESQDQATVEGLFGTPYYMSPEQASGTPLDHRTDLYSAAVVLYEMISGKVPHEGDGVHALVFSIASDPPIPLRKWMPDLPLSYYKFFDKALAMDADDRFQTAEEMREALRELSGQLARVQRHTELYLKAVPDDDAIPPPPRPGDTGPVRTWREARPIAGGPLEALSDDERERERGRPRGASAAAREIESASTVAEEESERETVSSPSNRLDVVTQEPGGSSLTDLRGASGSSVHTAEVAPIAARGLAIVGAVAVVVGLGVAFSLHSARAAEGAVDWGEIGLAWLLPTVVIGGLGIWWLSHQSDARSRRR